MIKMSNNEYASGHIQPQLRLNSTTSQAGRGHGDARLGKSKRSAMVKANDNAFCRSFSGGLVTTAPHLGHIVSTAIP